MRALWQWWLQGPLRATDPTGGMHAHASLLHRTCTSSCGDLSLSDCHMRILNANGADTGQGRRGSSEWGLLPSAAGPAPRRGGLQNGGPLYGLGGLPGFQSNPLGGLQGSGAAPGGPTGQSMSSDHQKQ